MKTATFTTAICLAAGLSAADASAFCIYNDTNSKTYSSAIDYQVSGRFEARLEPGTKSCCNFKEKSCNPTGKQDSLVDHEMKVVSPGASKGYRTTVAAGIGGGDYLNCAPPRKKSGLTDSTNFYTAKVQGGGWVKFVNNPAFNKAHYVSPDNPPYKAESYAFDGRLLASYTCPNAAAWSDPTRGPHGK